MIFFESVFDSVARRGYANQPKYDEDYVNPEDGLLYCGKCHTPRECVIEVPACLLYTSDAADE